MLANAFRHPPYLYLTHRVRQQAGSYRAAPGQLIVATRSVGTIKKRRSRASRLKPVPLTARVAFGGTSSRRETAVRRRLRFCL